MTKRERKSRDHFLQEILELCEKLAELRARELLPPPSKDLFFIDHQRCVDLIEFLPDATFVIDDKGTVVVWNRAIEEMTGVGKGDMLGKGNFEYSIPFYGKARPILIDFALRGESGAGRYYRFVERERNTLVAEVFAPRMYADNGAYLWGKASPLYDHQGKIIGAVESIRDITEWKNAEEAGRKSEEQFRALVETMNEGLSVLDENGIVLYANDKLCEMTGYQREEGIGLPEIQFFDEKSRAILAEHQEKRRRNIKSSYEVELLRKDGTKLPTIISGTPVFDDLGNLRGTIATVTDITLQKQVERKLRESEEKYRRIFENSPLGILHFDCRGIVTDCNANILKIWGTEKEKILGFNLLTSLQDRKMKTAVSACVQGRATSYEGSYVPVEGGGISYIKADYGPILSEDGRVLGGIAILEDITQRKETQEALLLSEQRWRRLSSKLLISQEEERKGLAESLRGVFDLHFQTAMLGVEDLLAREKSEWKRKMLHGMIHAVQDASQGIRKITDHLRLPLLDQQGVLATVRWLCDRFQERHPAIHIEQNLDAVEKNIPDLLKIVIYRVIQEALTNILKHSGTRRACLSIQEADSTLHLLIRDYGLGFDAVEVLEKDPLKKAFGLPRMRERVELSGGSFSIESIPNRGTKICARWALKNS